ncbi:MAG: ABC transporter permease [Actinomycetes bacterium]
MVPYVIRRLTLMCFMLLLLSVITFILFNAVPTDPAALSCGVHCTPEKIAQNRIKMGLDQPLPVQYFEWVKGIFIGRTYGSGTQTFDCSVPCLGYSFHYGEEVTNMIVTALPVTLYLALGAFILWMFGGILSGIYAAKHRGKWQDKTIMGLTLIGYSLPVFFIGLILLIFVVVRMHVLPYPDYISPLENFPQFLRTMILPWISLAILYAAYYTRLTRSQMLETMSEDFIRTARAKGLTEKVVVRKHALRAGLTPIVTSAGLDLAGLLGGAVITEFIFSLPGMGRLAIHAVTDYDLPTITATTLVAAAFIIVMNIVVDVLYAAIDPRVRLT